MSIYNLAKSALPLSLRIWLRGDLRMLLQRAMARLRGSGPTPPPELIHLVTGSYELKGFLESGATSADALRDTLKKVGVSIETMGSILDFGCGAGRVMLQWKKLRVDAHGTDYNPAMIKWCAQNLPFAEFRLNPLDGPLPYEDHSFDLVYACSVFTHLSEDLQRYWLGEMRRVLKPGAFLYVTLHGESYLHTLDEKTQEVFKSGELVVVEAEQSGTNLCAAYHPEAYVREEFAPGFSVELFVPEGARGGSKQDAYLLRKN